jgi:hypothetical protein
LTPAAWVSELTDIALGSASVIAAWKASTSFLRVRTARGSLLSILERPRGPSRPASSSTTMRQHYN